jgi:hypothetical protein
MSLADELESIRQGVKTAQGNVEHIDPDWTQLLRIELTAIWRSIDLLAASIEPHE